MFLSTGLKKPKNLLKLLVMAPVALLVILAWTATDESLGQLRLDYAALRAAEDDYRAQRKFSGLDGVEAADYAGYIAKLQRRVFEACERVIRSGASLPDDLSCPEMVAAETRSADISTQTEQTTAEQIAALDDQLRAGLGEYDERLLREQERIKAAAPNNNPGANSSGGGDGGSGDGSGDLEGLEGLEGAEGSEGAEGAEGETVDKDGGGRNAGGLPAGEPGAGDSSDPLANGPRDSSSGRGDRGKDSDEPADIPDGSDDDVVARQLREAAERETDPELKAKLWEEYRRYKRGIN